MAKSTGRREFMTGALATVVAGAQHGMVPRVGRTEVEHLQEAAARVRVTDMRSGGELALGEAIGVARAAEQLVGRVRVSSALRGELLAAVGWLNINAGFACHDAGREREAAARWRVALDCGAVEENASLVARALHCKARQAIWLGHPGDAVASLDRAVHLDRRQLRHTERAMIWALAARASVRVGDFDRTFRAVRWSDGMLALGERDDLSDRPWVSHYDLAHHYGDTAIALGDLARLGHGTLAESTERQRAAVAGHVEGALRSRALGALALATLGLDVGDPTAAVAEGHEALDLAAGMRSARIRSQVEVLRNAAGRSAARGHAASAGLRDRAVDALKT